MMGSAKAPLGLTDLHQLCLVAYGWMPRIARLDPKHTPQALLALQLAQTATPSNLTSVRISNLALCLRSVVGASKVLHFVNPSTYPIWDSNIERFRQKANPTTSFMGEASNYLAYANEVHAISTDPGFPGFHAQFNQGLASWLAAIGVPPYQVCNVRAIELAAFELSRRG